MYSQKCNYIISGYLPPSENSQMGGYGFSISLRVSFAKKCLLFKITDKQAQRMNKICKTIHKQIMNFEDRDPLFFEYLDKEQTVLLNFATVLGNACDLGICGFESNRILEMNDDDFIEYHPHNVDSIKQAYALLSIWLQWYDFAYALVDSEKS